MMQTLPIMIIGPGAVGCLLASRMARAGGGVRLLDYRADRAARLRHIRLTDDDRTTDVPVRVSADPALGAECGGIIVCVKAFQTAAVAGRIAPFIRPETCVLSLQNGLGNIESLQQALASQPPGSRGRSPSSKEANRDLTNGGRASSRAEADMTVSRMLKCRDLRPGVLNAGTRLVAEGHVHATGGNCIAIAGNPEEPVCQEWKRILTQAGFSVQLEPDTQRLLWTKLVLNAAINPVTALYRIPNGMLPAHPEAAALARDLLLESARIARSTGIALDDDDILQQRLLAICETTSENRSSMLCDVETGRATEIDAINGAILRHARAHGLDAPVNAKLIETFLRD